MRIHFLHQIQKHLFSPLYNVPNRKRDLSTTKQMVEQKLSGVIPYEKIVSKRTLDAIFHSHDREFVETLDRFVDKVLETREYNRALFQQGKWLPISPQLSVRELSELQAYLLSFEDIQNDIGVFNEFKDLVLFLLDVAGAPNTQVLTDGFRVNTDPKWSPHFPRNSTEVNAEIVMSTKLQRQEKSKRLTSDDLLRKIEQKEKEIESLMKLVNARDKEGFLVRSGDDRIGVLTVINELDREVASLKSLYGEGYIFRYVFNRHLYQKPSWENPVNRGDGLLQSIDRRISFQNSQGKKVDFIVTLNLSHLESSVEIDQFFKFYTESDGSLLLLCETYMEEVQELNSDTFENLRIDFSHDRFLALSEKLDKYMPGQNPEKKEIILKRALQFFHNTNLLLIKNLSTL